jgi:MOSC domain-containing protein YiiM
MSQPGGPDGRVLAVNVSAGGVPKRPVGEAYVGRLGLEGDRHRANTVHGGPLRAVCLLGIEVIERLQAEGHPIEPGSVGENFTTSGVELAALPPGTRLAVGGEVILEVTAPAMPCDTIVDSFRDGKSGRISILLHPRDSRMYARVLCEGTVLPGDRIRITEADPDSDAAAQVALFRLESVDRFAHVSLWRAAEAAGFAIDIVDDGELAVGSSRDLPDSASGRCRTSSRSSSSASRRPGLAGSRSRRPHGPARCPTSPRSCTRRGRATSRTPQPRGS